MSAKAEKELTGRHVLMMVVAFFAVIIAVNAYFITVAVQSFRGEDVPRSYRQGLDYNKTIAARSLQNDLGWTVRVNNTDANIVLVFQDKMGRPINNLDIDAKLRHPVDTDQDRLIAFSSAGEGRYVAPQTEKISGRWSLIGNAQTDTQQFKFEYDLWE